jgi:hypothetical protein
LRRNVSGLIRGVSAALLVGVVAIGCGSKSSTPSVPTTSACLQLSASIADEASRFVHTYQPGYGVGSTSDVAYFGLRTVLGGFKQQHCATRVLGRTLARRLTRKQQRELFLHLPRAMSAYFRLAITESRAEHA